MILERGSLDVTRTRERDGVEEEERAGGGGDGNGDTRDRQNAFGSSISIFSTQYLKTRHHLTPIVLFYLCKDLFSGTEPHIPNV